MKSTRYINLFFPLFFFSPPSNPWSDMYYYYPLTLVSYESLYYSCSYSHHNGSWNLQYCISVDTCSIWNTLYLHESLSILILSAFNFKYTHCVCALVWNLWFQLQWKVKGAISPVKRVLSVISIWSYFSTYHCKIEAC